MLSYDKLVDSVLDARNECAGSIDFNESLSEYRDGISDWAYGDYPEDYDIAETLYRLDRLHADVCKIFLNSNDHRKILTQLIQTQDLLAFSACYDRKKLLLARKLPKPCREEAHRVAQIFRVYAKSLAKSRDLDFNPSLEVADQINLVNQMLLSRLSAYLDLLSKHDQPVVIFHDDDLGPFNSFSMKIRYVSADAIYSINKYLEAT